MPDMSQLASDPATLRRHATTSQSHAAAASSSHGRPFVDSSNASQTTATTTPTTTNSTGTDRVFTPPGSDSEGSNRHGNDNGNGASSSQESQLIQLSNLAALQQKIVVSHDDADINGAQSRKRTADGGVKHTRHHSSASPIRGGHSRNTSTVSVASTTSSRIGELSAELKAKLSYALVKVNNGWQSHSIDEVESLASQAASPTSSTSTLHGRHGSSASPRIALAGFRHAASNPSSMATSPIVQNPQARTYESFWRESVSKIPTTTNPNSQVPTLAPPAPIQPRQSLSTNPRRNSNARHTPAYLSQSHHTSPHTPSQPSPLQSTPGQHYPSTPNVDPILFSPPQNLREQEALETLMFMSSPGNSANLKHAFPTPHTAQPRTSARTPLLTSRLGHTAELNSQGRRALPTGRPQAHQSKRVEFERSPSTLGALDIDEQYSSLQVRAMPRRRTLNGAVPRPLLSIPAGLGGPARTKPPLGDEDVQRMIDRAAAADSSDSEGEIQLPPNTRRNGTGVGV
ncbi:putative cell cycle transcriptional repressor whi5 [Rosellinia necatrix]|uniref:Putative cell cycle transcriptional repressor whi5 n=1 Tax=Rosellinia necatrix TaxID=77044 RepID=A0A1W2TFU0_ROSNE|nr:putative cell cycle transcriptional repressor whi5 [Rosellinia necatrix]